MPKRIVSPEGHSWCSTCQQHLPVDHFHKRGGGREGFNSRCKACDKQKHDAQRQSKPGHKPLVRAKDAPVGQSWCPLCEQFKAVSEFTKDSRSKNGCYCYCKPCTKTYYATKKEQYYPTVRKYQIAHRTPIVHKYKFPEGPIAPACLAYIAGLFDAEGTFVFTAGAPSASLYNNNRSLLEHVQNAVGGSILETSRNGWYFYSLTFANQPIVKKLCEFLIPFLVLKKRRAEILVAAMELERCNRGELAAELVRLNAKCVKVEPPEQKVPAVQRDISTANETEWAYFAGWIDGDGLLHMQKQVFNNTYFYPKIAVYNTKPEPLFYLHTRFGGKIEWRDRVATHATEFSLRIDDSEYVATLLEGLKPHIVAKKEQVEVLIDAMRHDPKDRQEHFDKMKELNGRHRHVRIEADANDQPEVVENNTDDEQFLFPPEGDIPCES